MTSPLVNTIASNLLLGKIVVIRRSGEDGSIFPLTVESCMIGRAETCSIRVQLPAVAEHQCRIDVMEDGTVRITNLAQTNPTKINSRPLKGTVALCHDDMIGIVDRYFRFEYPDGHPMATNGAPPMPRRSSSVRKSLSPKQVPEGQVDSKVVTPSRKPPLPLSSDDIENVVPDIATSPDDVSGQRFTRRRSSPSSLFLNKSRTKILTPKSKPPPPSGVTRLQNVETSAVSPGVPKRRSKSLRQSLSEIKQKANSIVEEASDKQELMPERPLKGKRGRKSESNLSDEAVASKRKRVSFGGYLSPELFDKTLPPGTPVRRGNHPKRLSIDSALVSSPAKGLLKGASSETTISEESPRRSPRFSAGASTSTPSPASTSASDRKSRHVTVKSPHIPHHEMSDQEQRLYAAQRRQEGAAFRRHSHSPPDGCLSPPLTPPNEKLVASSASPALAAKKSLSTSKSNSTPTSPRRTSPRGRTSKSSSPLVKSPGRKIKSTTPKPARSIMTPKRGHVIHTDTPRPKTPRTGTPTTANGQEEVEKIVTPPIDFRKAVALRAIHGKSATPALSPSQKQRLKNAPQGSKRLSSNGKSPKKLSIKKSWADVVKTSKRRSLKGGVEKKKVEPKRLTVSKKTKSVKTHLTPKPKPVNRRGFAQSTGHIDSPDTIVIRKAYRATPKKTPVKTRTSVYDSLPPTPSPPTIMFVSPLNGEKPRRRRSPLSKVVAADSSPDLKGVKELMEIPKGRKSISLKGVKETFAEKKPRKSMAVVGLKETFAEKKPRKSTSLVGIKEAFHEQKSRRSVNYAGVKKLMQETKSKKKPVSLVGVKEIFYEPKSRKSVRLTGVRELMQEAKSKKKPVSLVGVKEIFHEPKSRRSVRLTGVRELMQEAKPEQSVSLRGVKELLTANRPRKSVQLSGIKELVKTPDSGKSPRLAGVKELFTASMDTLSPGMTGVKEMMDSPRKRKSVSLSGTPSPNKKSKGTPVIEKQETPIKRRSRPAVTKAVKVDVAPTDSSRNDDGAIVTGRRGRSLRSTLQVVDEPQKSTTRSRKSNRSIPEVAEECAEPVASVAEPPKRRGRSTAVTKKAEDSDSVGTQDTTKRRGRSAKPTKQAEVSSKQDEKANVSPSKLDIEPAKTPEPAKRRGRSAKPTKQVDDSSKQDEKTTVSPSKLDIEPAKAPEPAKRRGRPTKPTKKVDDSSKQDEKTTVPPSKLDIEPAKAPEPATRRGRSTKSIKQAKESSKHDKKTNVSPSKLDIEPAKSPEPATRRGRSTKSMKELEESSKQDKKTNVSPPNHDIEPAKTPEPTTRRGRSTRSTKQAEAPSKQDKKTHSSPKIVDVEPTKTPEPTRKRGRLTRKSEETEKVSNKSNIATSETAKPTRRGTSQRKIVEGNNDETAQEKTDNTTQKARRTRKAGTDLSLEQETKTEASTLEPAKKKARSHAKADGDGSGDAAIKPRGKRSKVVEEPSSQKRSTRTTSRKNEIPQIYSSKPATPKGRSTRRTARK